MTEGDSRQQLEIGVSPTLAMEVRQVASLLQHAPAVRDAEDPAYERVLLHPRFRAMVVKMLNQYGNSLTQR